ncbi:MAG: hypothetical protein KFH87_04005, partial [Bacteroidetes bacterium]|nr:hypothetical protein [Bacteroidota bacterium]
WLGQVPTHWRIVPNKAVFRMKPKRLVGELAAEYVLLSLTKLGVIARDMVNPEGKFPASFDTYQIVEPGDLIFCMFDIDETPRAVGLSDLGGMIAYSDKSVHPFRLISSTCSDIIRPLIAMKSSGMSSCSDEGVGNISWWTD